MQEQSAAGPNHPFRRWVIVTLGSIMAVLGLLTLEVYVFDPFMHYHAPWFGYGFVGWNETYLNPGLAKHTRYDAVVVGGSYVQNAKVSSVDAALGVNAVKLTKAGGTPADLHRLLRLGLESGQRVKLAIVTIPLTKFESEKIDAIRSELPEYLYDGNGLNDLSYLLNVDVYIAQAKAFWNSLHSPHKSEKQWLDEAYSWIGNYKGKTGKAYLLKHYVPPQPREALPADWFVARAEDQFDAHLRPLIEAHPETAFKFYFPPFSRLLWRDRLEAGTLRADLEVKRVLAERLLAYTNVELFDFMALPETADLDNYKDRSHYLPPVMELVTAAMASGDHRMTAVPKEQDVAEFIDLVRAYDDPDIPRSANNGTEGAAEDNPDNF